MGLSEQGINREVAASIECADLARKHKDKPLGKPRQAVIKLASLIPPYWKDDSVRERKRMLTTDDEALRELPSWETIARGILPSLRYILREFESGQQSGKKEDGKILPDIYPNQKNYRGFVDPYASWFHCESCHCELANLYYSCDGCENLLRREYNLCLVCYKNDERDPRAVYGGFDDDVETNQINWTPKKHHVPLDKKPGKVIRKCDSKRCRQGSMTCNNCALVWHTEFTQHQRFYNKEKLDEILQNCTEMANGGEVAFSVETEERLNGNRVVLEKVISVPNPYYPSSC